MAATIAKLVISGIIVIAVAANSEEIGAKIRKITKWLKQKLKGETSRAYTYEEETKNSTTDGFPDSDVMDALLCPISQELMTDPVITPYGHCFQKYHIELWLENNDFCPLTREKLFKRDLKPCYTLKYAVDQFIKVQDKSKFD